MRHTTRTLRSSLVIALALSVASTAAIAQGNVGNIFGHGPAGATVTATSTTGAQRHATLDAKGRYSISAVPMGTYAVALEKDGQTVDTRANVGITVGRGAEVDSAGRGQGLPKPASILDAWGRLRSHTTRSCGWP